MKNYSVKEIAEMLGTNPETVRRWIRDDKLKAVQLSRKEGNVVSEAELERFVRASPKYVSKLAAGVGLAAISPTVFGVLAGGIAASALLDYFDDKKNAEVRVLPEDLKEHLRNNIDKLREAILQKQALIHQTKAEIAEISKQIERYTYLLEHEEFLAEMLEKATINMKGGKA